MQQAKIIVQDALEIVKILQLAVVLLGFLIQEKLNVLLVAINVQVAAQVLPLNAELVKEIEKMLQFVNVHLDFMIIPYQ